MPRRLLVLSAETDELAGWKQVLLKLQHEEKARRRKELEAAGEEVEDEDAEEEEAAEQPALPEEEEEREELFDKNAGDVLRTMAEFVPAPPLEQPKALPPIPEVSLDPQPEPADDEALAKGHEDAVRILHVDQEVPLLSLRADGRPPSEVADLLEVAAGQLRCPRAPLPKMLEGEGAEEPKELLRLDLDEKQVSRRWSQWRQHCPVALYDKRLVPGGKEFAAEYAGYAFCFSSAAAQRRFCAWPKLFLTDAPRINAPGMHLGYVLLSPMGFRVPELAARVSERYGFDVVDVAALVQRAVQLKASDQPPLPPQEVEGEGGQERPRTPAPEEDEEEPGAPRLLVAEKAALLAGAPLGAETLARLVGEALGIAKNTAILQKQQDDIAEAKRVLEEFAAREPPEDAEEGDAGPAAPEYELDEEGEPVIPLSEPLLVPPRGFVLTGFPGSAEQLELLRSKLRLEIERVLVVKPMAEEEPKEPAEILAELGFGQDAPMESHLESQAAGFESLAALEDLQLSDVAMEATEDEQFIQIQKAIDPFYEVADDAEVADEIPDPDEWEEPPAEEPEEGEPPPDPLELPRRPTIPWGVCGPYCPVTLKEDDWLFPGQKANQHMYKNKVYALANEAASAKFVAEPSKYVPSSGEPPIPRVRVLVTGPTGSGVERQCQLLAEACKMPVVKVEGEWRARVEARLQAARAAVKEAAAAEKLLEPLLADEGVAWPPGWTPPEPKPEGEDEDDPEQDGGGQEEKEPEEDGLDDEGREALYVAAMRDVLGSHCGACILDGTFFGDLQNEELDDGAKEARSLQQLLIKAQRIPDITIVLKCKNEVAVANALDCEAIDREYAEKKAAYEKLVAEAEEKEEDPPDPPDGLVLDADEDEKESDRAKAKFVEQKQAEQQVLKELTEALKEARGVVQKISADRGEEPTQTALRWHCRPYVEQRGSIFIKHQMAKVTPSQSLDLAQRGLAQTSRFEMAGPLFMDTPLFAGRPDAYRYPTEFRRRLYYPRGTAEQEQLLERPVDFIYQPSPSRVAVHPAVAISGPPLAGKTFLARALAERTGAVYVSVPEVLERLCSQSAMPCGLSRSITEALRAGGDVPDRLLTEAVRHRLCAADVLSRGWVLDDFPSTEAQARSLSAAGIVPHRVLVLGAPAGLVLGRSRELRGRPGLGGAGGDLAQQEPPLQRLCLDAYRQRAPLLRTYYSFAFDNVRDIDASRSAWPISDHALRETSAAITQRLEYYRRTAGGLAARVYGMCLSRERLQETESDFKNYCPVTLTLSSELVQCCDPRCVVEYKSKVYWISSEDKTRSFLDDPDSFLQVPLPSALPRLLTPMERRTFSSGCELEGHCPVALLDGQELVKASGNHSAFYQLKYWTFENKEACEKFMRRPSRYAQKAKLPGKRPETQDADTQQLLRALTSLNGRTIEQDSMLTYMQSSISEIICQAMVQSGQRRPLYPGKTPQESALLFLARFLKAKNSIATDLYAAAVRAEYEEFLNDCAVPQLLNDLMQQERDGTKTWTEWDRKRFKDLKLHFDALFENVDAQASGRRRSSQSR